MTEIQIADEPQAMAFDQRDDPVETGQVIIRQRFEFGVDGRIESFDNPHMP